MLEPRVSSAAATPNHVRLYKAFLWMWTIVFALQLGAAYAAHDHAFADELADCVTCQVAGSAAVPLPGPPPAMLAILLVVAYLIARRPNYVSITPRRLYLIPPRQAPPVHPSF